MGDLFRGFAFSVAKSEDCRPPVIPKSYHKINTGPFVQTPFGPRLLRQFEIERIHGCQLRTWHYATAVHMLGHGVKTRFFAQVLQQLGEHFAPRRI